MGYQDKFNICLNLSCVIIQTVQIINDLTIFSSDKPKMMRRVTRYKKHISVSPICQIG